MDLPPGQRAVQGLPRFGVDRAHAPPTPPEGMTIDCVGPLTRRVAVLPADLAALPRRTITADLHCVAGWSAVSLRWDGVLFSDFYRTLVEPALRAGTEVGYVVFVGLDGYRSIVTLEDALGDDVLLADRLAGQLLTPDHGAPVRLVSPRQYGYISTKHLCRIELYRFEPTAFYHSTRGIQRALKFVHPHRRARVRIEERHRYLPSWLARRVYRSLVKLPADPLNAGPPASGSGSGSARRRSAGPGSRPAAG